MTQQPSQWTRRSPTIRVGVLGLFAAFLLVLPLPSPRAPRRTSTGRMRRPEQRRSAAPTSTAPASTRASSAAPAPGGEIAVDARHVYWTHSDGPDRPRQARRHRRRPELHRRRDCAEWTASRWTPATSTGRPRADRALDRPRQPRRHRRRPELHHGAGISRADVAVDARHVYWTEPATSGRSIGRANLDGTGVDQASSPTPGLPARRRGRRRPHLLEPATATRARSPAPSSTARTSTRASSAGAGLPCGVAVDANHVYWADYLRDLAHGSDRPRQPRRHAR